jgi:hypothetical protein
MESCDFRQLTQASVRHSELHAKASNSGKYPPVREIATIAGLKTRATTSNATVVVYVVPVGFWFGSNISNPLGCAVAKGKGGLADLAQLIRRAAREGEAP